MIVIGGDVSSDARTQRHHEERRRPRPAAHGEPWSFQINGTVRRVTVTVVVPARNEAPNLPALFASLPPVHEVILVDGNSVDGTIETAQRLLPGIRVIRQQGKGKGADLAKGSRFLQSGGSVDITGIRRFGNASIRTFVNRMYGTRFTDLAYGYNALWTRHREQLALDCAGFEVETLLHVRAARAGLTIQEVPSFEGRRHVGASNLHAVRDGFRIAMLLVRELADQAINGQTRSRP
jgi:Glycosyl transferase family 2